MYDDGLFVRAMQWSIVAPSSQCRRSGRRLLCVVWPTRWARACVVQCACNGAFERITCNGDFERITPGS